MRRFLTFTLILGVFATLLGLGTWQVQRLAWKQDLIAEAETRPTQPAVPLVSVLAEDEDQRAYRRVFLEGSFVGEDVRVFTTLSDAVGVYEGPGYWLMTPFEDVRTDAVLFVNRGFIPYELPPQVRISQAPVGQIRFEGLVRPNDRVDWATPEPDLEERVVFRRDIDQMASLAGLRDVLPVTVDMPASILPGLPQAGETKFTFSNRHLEYAFTWYALAAVLAAIVGVVMFQRRMRFV